MDERTIGRLERLKLAIAKAKGQKKGANKGRAKELEKKIADLEDAKALLEADAKNA